jgi:hypothetical protein
MAAWHPQAQAQQAIGVDAWHSDDADGSRVAKAGIVYDFRHDSDSRRDGIRLERARFAPAGGHAVTRDAVYWRFAGGRTDAQAWSWMGMLGSDGHTWLGNASLVRNGARRVEYFVEREAVETPIALREGVHATFAGAAVDLPWNRRDTSVLLGGVQAFGDGNRRTHLRLTQVHVLSDNAGLSLQLRLRYARDSDPHALDYYAPRWYARAVPVVQWRRFRSGWQYRLAAGAGRQADADAGWRAARLLEAAITSPADRAWGFQASLVHTDEPSGSGQGGYRYTQAMVSVTRKF